jgi:hypothetical protein
MSPERLRLCARITQPRRRPRRARQRAAANGLADTARSILQELEVVAAAERVDVAVTLRSGGVAGAGGDGPAQGGHRPVGLGRGVGGRKARAGDGGGRRRRGVVAGQVVARLKAQVRDRPLGAAARRSGPTAMVAGHGWLCRSEM